MSYCRELQVFKFGHLTVIDTTRFTGKGQRHVLVQCSCGAKEERRVDYLVSQTKAGKICACKQCSYDAKRNTPEQEAAKKERHKGRYRLYRFNNRERVLQAKSLHYYLNRERILKEKARYRKDNHEKIASYRVSHLEQCKSWRIENQERLRLFHRHYYLANQNHLKLAAKNYRLNNPEKILLFSRSRTARKKNAVGNHTIEDVRKIWERQKHRCAVPFCDEPISVAGKHKYHVDHVVALVNGGSNNAENLQILCRHHNLSKNDSDDREWANRIGLLFVK